MECWLLRKIKIADTTSMHQILDECNNELACGTRSLKLLLADLQVDVLIVSTATVNQGTKFMEGGFC